MRRRAFLATGLAAFAAPAAEDYRHTPGFHSLYNLDYDRAIEVFEAQSLEPEADGDSHNFLASALLFRTLFRADALDGAVALSVSDYLHKPKVAMSTSDRSRFLAALSKAESISRARIAKNPNSAEALYTLGEAYTNRANLALLVDKEWRAALKTGGEARTLHTQALEKDKTLIDAMLVPSIHEYVVGNLPIYLKALGFLVGFSGDREKGLNGLRMVAAKGLRAKVEAQVLLALVDRREDRPKSALAIMRALAGEFPTNHLYRREVANILLDSKRKDEARSEFAELGDPRYRFLKPQRLELYKREFEARLRA
ncbi:hypothetical protein [Bryobacter aggregatus]|uniref:hypothetical protein n=1 Tax=Bryobacter aggregatus TaxID=360054 RepID=UPI0004E1C3C3|nr:hypothetical protein [Bryobacter aggregatus]